MKITELETLRVEEFPNLLFVQLHTDEGLTGLGETFYGAEAVEAQLHSVVAPYLLGQDPFRIAQHGRATAGYVGYAGSGAETRARSAVDLALWDILGKAAGLPVHDLIGGRTRESVPIYNTCAGARYVNAASGQSVANWGLGEGRYEDLYAAIHHPAELARDLLDHGITGMKVWPFDTYAEQSGGTSISARDLDRAMEPLRRIREEVGDDMDLMIELHALWDVPTAERIVRALEEVSPFWIEDPVRSDLVGGLARVSDATSARVAAGETVSGPHGFQALLGEGGIGVVTVDTTWCGGLSAAIKTAAVAETYGIPIAPHDCTGPVALTACTHLSTAAPNVLVQETVRAGYRGWYSSLVEGGPVVEGGRISAPRTPGLGIELLPDLRARDTTVTRSSR
jgi:galactonate dehydratase